MVKQSPRILRDSRKYVKTYLNADFNEYTAVAFRIGNRKTVLTTQYKYSKKDVVEYFYKCAEEVKKYYSNIPQITRLCLLIWEDVVTCLVHKNILELMAMEKNC